MTRNVAASVRQRLLNHARAERRPFNEVLQYFALERFLVDFRGRMLEKVFRLPLSDREWDRTA